ncbi:MAG: leucine-rich repeat domain-containing protein [Clostridia bacterium]|nr:leucine-rich repeat domain-containing protein [Clostridia bacterium]
MLTISASLIACDKASRSLPTENSPIEEEPTTEQTATPADYFRFTLLDDDTYEISARYQDMPADTVLPSTYNGKEVTSIASRAFEERESIDTLTIPASIANVNDMIFGDQRENPITIRYLGSLREWCEMARNDASLSTQSDLYINNAKLEGSLTVPSDTIAIGAYAFYKRDELVSVTLPNSVTDIGAYAFCECTGLRSITLPESLTNIGAYAFADCHGLTSFVIPDRVTKIEHNAFMNCFNLTSLTIGAKVTTIEDVDRLDDTFSYCYKLVEIYNRSSLPITKGDLTYGQVAFYAKEVYQEAFNSKLRTDENGFILYRDAEDISLIGYNGNDTELIIPAMVTDIHAGAFYRASELTAVSIPDSVTHIADHAFESCTKLSAITIPQNVRSIGAFAFRSCSSLSEITIENGVQTIGQEAFPQTDISEISIPNSVTSIDTGAFLWCFQLRTVMIGTGMTTLNAQTFFGSPVASIHLPSTITDIETQVFSTCPDIHYDGTTEDWGSIRKERNWNQEGNYTVHCSDTDLVVTIH